MIKKREDFVIYLKFLACILITNSHCREIHPISFFAIGGGFGNALFFGLSGFCLANINNTFIQWYKKRAGRIIPTLLLIIAISLCFGEGRTTFSDLRDLFEIFIFMLNKYWFVFAILIYYPIFYCVFSSYSKYKMRLTWILYVVLYFFFYAFLLDKSMFCVELEGFSLFKVYFYIGVFLAGGYLGKLSHYLKGIKDNQKRKYTKCLGLIGILAVLGWGMIYMFITIFERAYIMQFLIHGFVFIFCVCVICSAIMNSDKIRLWEGGVCKSILIVSESTLEIYLIQVTFWYWVIRYGFPLNEFLFWSIALGGGILFHMFCKKLFDIKRLFIKEKV